MDKEKQVMWMKEWNEAVKKQYDYMDAIVALSDEGRAFTIETLVSAYGDAQEQATRAMLRAGFENDKDISEAWIHLHLQEERELANAE